MKKAKKFLAILCACCMTLAMMAPAFAVEAAPISDNAGKTVQCLLYTDDPSEQPYTIDIFIPATASDAEEAELVNAAAMTAVFGSSATRAARTFPVLSEVTNIPTMMDGVDAYVGGGTLDTTYPVALVTFKNLTSGNGASTLTVTLENESISGMNRTREIDLYTTKQYVGFAQSDKDGLRMEAGNKLSFYATTDRGYADADSCTVSLSLYDPY